LGHKKKGKFGVKIRPENYYPPVQTKKKGVSTGMKVLIGLALITVMVVAGSFAFSLQSPPNAPQPSGPSGTTLGASYPRSVNPLVYTAASVTSEGNKVTVPANVVSQNKLVFVDLPLTSPAQVLPYNGRSVPLAYYRNGGYLPLVFISTPSGNTIAGIRTCEPCGSFSFHIVSGTNLKCDVCGAEWDLEDFAPRSGGCSTYPPPKLTATVNGESVEVDLSTLPVQVRA
jgi:hypothetical protein